MKKRYRWDKKVFAKNMLTLMLILMMLWAVVSYCEILIKNTNLNGGVTYSKWNLWTMCLDTSEN